MKALYPFLFSFAFFLSLQSQSTTEIKRFKAPNASQAIAVDSLYFYTISNSKIIKRKKSDGAQVAEWSGPLKHLNSGIIFEGKLYCSNTNYPEVPMASSLEIYDTETLEHIANHSFGHYLGSFTWIDKLEKDWYLTFVHYSNQAKERDKGVEYTSMIRTDSEFRRKGGWTMPKKLVEHLSPMSVSGGFFLKDGRILLSSHHFEELYLCQFPKMGYELEWLETIPVPFQGQGIAYDSYEDSIWGIHRKNREVIVIELN